MAEISFKDGLVQKLKWPWILPIISAVFTAFICLKVFGGAIAGYGDVSAFTVKIQAIIPCAVLGIIVGIVSYHKWYLSVLLGSAPPFLLLLLMLYGIFLGNSKVYLEELHWTVIPIGIIGALFTFALLGFAIRKASFYIANIVHK